MSSCPEVMRVGIDGRCLNRAHLRGMGKALWRLLDHGARQGAVDWKVYAERPDLPMHAPASLAAAVDCFERRGHRLHAWEQVGLPLRARGHRIDLLHCPATRVPWWQPIPTVVTVHDIMPWQAPEPDWPSGFYLNRLLPRAIRKCALVITISESSRRDMLTLWPDLAEKIRVVPHGVDDRYLDLAPDPLGPTLTQAGVRAPYLLYLGGEIARKRVDWALRVFSELGDAAVQLVVCGVERTAAERVAAQVPAAVRARVVFAPFISEQDMPRLYQNAAAVLYPTLYEGFGLPALEAQAVGAPVVFSALGSLAELQGPGSVVLDPNDLTAWVEVCRKLLLERTAGSAPNTEARRWARRYSWDVCAQKHMEIYREALLRVHRQPQAGPSRATL